MPLNASWVHGTALAIETPANLDHVGYFGWGADMAVKLGKSSWFHVPFAYAGNHQRRENAPAQDFLAVLDRLRKHQKRSRI